MVVVNGGVCTPCKALWPHLQPDAVASQMLQLRDGWSGEGLTVLQRSENEGMDFAAHNVCP